MRAFKEVYWLAGVGQNKGGGRLPFMLTKDKGATQQQGDGIGKDNGVFVKDRGLEADHRLTCSSRTTLVGAEV